MPKAFNAGPPTFDLFLVYQLLLFYAMILPMFGAWLS